MNAPEPKTKTILPFAYNATGYAKAKKFLQSIERWDQVAEEGISTNGYTMIKEANTIHNKLASKEFRNYKNLVLFDATLHMDRDFSEQEKELYKQNDKLFKNGFLNKKTHAVTARQLLQFLNQN